MQLGESRTQVKKSKPHSIDASCAIHLLETSTKTRQQTSSDNLVKIITMEGIKDQVTSMAKESDAAARTWRLLDSEVKLNKAIDEVWQWWPYKSRWVFVMSTILRDPWTAISWWGECIMRRVPKAVICTYLLAYLHVNNSAMLGT